MYAWISRLLLFVAISSQNAWSLSNFSPGDLSDLQQTNVDELIKLVALGANHRQLLPARPLGLGVGLEIGVDVTGVVVPDEFKAALALAADSSAGQVPSLLPLPKISFYKGLPAGIDLGFSFISYQSSISFYGASVQWAFLSKSAVLPNAAVRFNAAYAKVWFIQTRNFALDAVVSKRFSVIEPYLGTGLQMWNGSLSVSSSSLPASLSASNSGVSPHVFFGFPIKLVFIRIVGEIDYNFSGVTSYGGKVALSF
jgi:hypothetical protein